MAAKKTTKATKQNPEIETENKEQMTPEQYQQAVAQVLQSYFTDDVNERIRGMSDDEMWNTLRDMESTPGWIAMLKYVGKRLLVAQQVINQLDPITQPTALSRTQGIMTGVVDVQNVVIQLVEAEKASREESQRIISAI